MLKRSIAGAALAVALTTGTAMASGGDTWFDIHPDQPGVDAIITTPGKSEGGEAPGKKPGQSAPVGSTGPRQPTLGDAMRAACAAQVGLALGGANNNPLCLALQAQEGEDGPDVIDAAAVAQRLKSRLDLPRPQMSTSPEAPVKALVGLQTWLWINPAQWQPLDLSASLEGTTVTVTATPVQSRWDMGEGSTTCAGPGRPWRKGLGQAATTSCGYTYKHTSTRQPGKKYDVSAQVRYSIRWTCTGDACSAPAGDLGTLDTVPAAAQLEVGERQSVVVR